MPQIDEHAERQPLLGYRPIHIGQRVNSGNAGIFALMTLALSSISIGLYLLFVENQPYQIRLVFQMVERYEWGGNDRIPCSLPLHNEHVENVLIIQADEIQPCFGTKACSKTLREIQVNDFGENYDSGPLCKQMRIKILSNATENCDIPYNFLVGQDGVTYEVRGWSFENGFSALVPRNASLAIGLIGIYRNIEE